MPNFDIVGWHDHCNGDMVLHRTPWPKEAKTETARTGSRIRHRPLEPCRPRYKPQRGNIDFGPPP